MPNMTSSNGSQFKSLSNMTTTIPPSVFAAITQTKSSPETIAALLNEAEATHSPSPKHWNAKRVYPFWKTCKICLNPFQCHTKEQAKRNQYCSRACVPKNPGKIKPMAERKGKTVACQLCGKEVWRPDAWLRKYETVFCSRQCNGRVRGAEWAKHAHKGRAAWTKESEENFVSRMRGKANPAWKGGVTYFRKHGNYKPIKYVRCPEEFLVMARKDGYVMEHRLLVAQAIGRPLLRSEVVHHRNHDPQDNAIANLELFASNRDHKLYEAHGSPDPIWRG
ncbi:MAG: hypothetical protein EBR82_36215 [Caulobacteraceae bacterium]|nr:hypothetical protein [Caulobacteraceae bacterium]